MPVVTIPTPLRPHTDGQTRVEAQGATVGAILSDLGTRYPEFHKRIFSASGELQQYVNVYVNSEDIRFLEDLETPVADRDVVDIIPAVAGG
ncbi:ubiquitin-like small modifier protein 1 [Singulisphaera sp. PoT]|uniref:ubiquitin-like small modifier protein 1 n=1 Tax=Singulisphaera sp. PoT TaxID=3411797 RepID=UPI003BF55B14